MTYTQAKLSDFKYATTLPLTDLITGRSNGLFIWVRLAVDKIRDLELADTPHRAEEVINETIDTLPQDLDELYADWFRQLVEALPITYPDRLRCLFVSQDDGVGRNDFNNLASIRIAAKDNKHDIHEYSRAEANKLKEKFELSEEEASRFAANVADAAKGMFSLARLVWTNLLGQKSIAGVEGQLGINFPDGIDSAYERIMDRIVQQASPVAMEDISWLLGWLACSKRPLKWHEIHSLESVNLDERSVEVEQNKFRVSAKDLFESLVEIQPDGTLELVHVTAKFFLVRSDRYVDVTAKEIQIACRCIDYLNLPAFQGQPTEDRVLNGEYGFMDYAVLHWVRHLEAGTIHANGHDQLMNELAESLETFIRQYWINPTATLPVSAGTWERLRYFQDLPFYGSLKQAIASSKKQLRLFGEMGGEEIALNLPDTVDKIRKALEQLVSSDLEPSIRERIEERYGSNLFKCDRFSCQFFTAGFPSAQDRDSHIGKHTRPFRCAYEACTGFVFGFLTAAERDKHAKNTHSTTATHDLEFPTDEDVSRSIQNKTAEEQANQEPTEFSASEPGAEQEQLLGRTRSKQMEFKCPHCPRVYARKWNLTRHLHSHRGGLTLRMCRMWGYVCQGK
ncbi:C2H2-type domain-containing protein [Fusarium sp. Ph1]|nr:C2H2-type domain-containing protein [Fusarium sp. Ph1]